MEYSNDQVQNTMGALQNKEGRKYNLFRDRITLQCIFNILSVVFIVMISLGLWMCLIEIKRLTESSKLIHVTVTDLLNRLEFDDSVKVDTKNTNAKPVFERFKKQAVERNNGKTAYDKKNVYRRAAMATYKTFDPLATEPKDPNEFCWTLLYERCGGYMAGAPSLGPPGPPGIPGPKGEPGRPGTMGHMGPPGVNGQKGHKGDSGATGRVGEPGSDGPRGPTGLPGINGMRGSDGRRGKRGEPGPPGRPGADGQGGVPGNKGVKGERGETGDLYTANGTNCTCRGQKGEKGLRGLVGFDGYKGAKGEPGTKGERGYGMQGYPGQRGPSGAKGEKGDQGYCNAAQCGDKYVRRTATPPIVTTTTTSTSTSTTASTTPTVPPSLAPKSTVCRVKRISTPIFVAHDISIHGSFLSDPMQRNKYWVARGYHGQFLEEYGNDVSLKKRMPDRRYNLRYNRFHGTQHAVYNNSFYYHFTGQQHVVRYDLELHDVVTAVLVPKSHYNNSKYLYKGSKSYYDVIADENGLWILFGRQKKNSSKIHLMKVDRHTLLMERVWSLPFDTGVYRNGFIACGILYLIADVEGKVTEAKLEVMYDLYTDEQKTIDIRMKIPFHRTTMLTFYTNTSSRKYSVLLAWDNGNLIKYPMLF